MIIERTVMVPLEQCCKQVIRHERRCSLKANHGDYCQQHKGRTLYDLVSYDTGIAKKQIDNVVAALVNRMGWEQVRAFQHEMARGQLYEDAGGYLMRAISKLFGARGRYDELNIYKRAAIESTRNTQATGVGDEVKSVGVDELKEFARNVPNQCCWCGDTSDTIVEAFISKYHVTERPATEEQR